MSPELIQVDVPIFLPEAFVSAVTNAVLKNMDERLLLLNRSIDLPPYANKSEVKEILRIGDDKLKSWINAGLKTQIWSEKDIRIERGELQQFLRTNFEV